MNIKENNVFSKFLSSNSKELLLKSSRLDELIGRDHWLSVGNYKESILRNLLSSTLPQKYEVSTGFILTADSEGKILKSKQIDIIIWDSTNYAPIFRDGEFVIVPPEACLAVVEVKGKLTRQKLHSSLLNIDSLIEFCATPYPLNNHIYKYIFAFDIAKELKFPSKLWEEINKSYRQGEVISLEERMDFSNKNLPLNSTRYRLFSVDAIFVLPVGAIIRELGEFRNTNNETRFIFEAYLTTSKNHNHTYDFFENYLQAHLSTNGHPGLQYQYQPGLYSVKRNINIIPTSPKSMIFPALKLENMLDNNVDRSEVFMPKEE